MANPNITSGPRVGTYNCNGLGNTNKRKKVLTWLKNKPEDVILVQETHSTYATESEWRRVWGGEIVFNHGTSNSTGIAILIKRNSGVKILKNKSIVQGRATLLEIEWDSINFCLVNLYAPNNDDMDFLNLFS